METMTLSGTFLPIKTILLFQISPSKLGRIESLCREIADRLPIRIKEVPKKDWGKKLGSLADIEGFTSLRAEEKYGNKTEGGSEASLSALPGEMLVFSGFTGEDLDLFLEEYKKRGIEKIPLKAALTPTNIGWTAEQLRQELLQEHNSLKQSNCSEPLGF